MGTIDLGYESKDTEKRIQWIMECDKTNIQHIQILAELAKSDPSDEVQKNAVDKITDQKTLLDIALHAREVPTRHLASDKITDDEIFLEYISNIPADELGYDDEYEYIDDDSSETDEYLNTENNPGNSFTKPAEALDFIIETLVRDLPSISIESIEGELNKLTDAWGRLTAIQGSIDDFEGILYQNLDELASQDNFKDFTISRVNTNPANSTVDYMQLIATVGGNGFISRFWKNDMTIYAFGRPEILG